MRPRRPNLYDLNALGVHFYSVGAYDLAIVQLEEAIRLAPEIACIHFNLGGAYYARDRITDAEEEFRQALSIEPGHVRAHWFRGLCLERMGHLDEALREFQWVLGHSTGTREANSAREEVQAIRFLREAGGMEAEGTRP